MDTQLAIAAPSRELVRQIAESHHEPKWLQARRLKALEVYHQAHLPDTVAHLWRYTDPAQFALDTEEGILPLESESSAEARALLSATGNPSGSAVLDNGGVLDVSLDENLNAKNVILLDLHQAAHHYPSLVEKHLGAIVSENHGKFEALNMALWQGGLLLHVPRNIVVDRPIHLVLSGDGASTFLGQRLLVVAEEGVEMTVIVEFTSPKNAGFHANTAVEIFGGANTNINCVCVQHWSQKVKWLFTQRARLERDAQFMNLWAGLGGRITKTNLGAILNGPGTNVRMYGITFGHKKQHFDQHTEHWHASGRSYSDLDFKVVLKDKARSAYTGLIRIEENATTCEAYQENRNLLVNDGPRVDTIPELEILNDEVKCTHGATIGPIDPMQLFYLQARGLPIEEAVRLIVRGFVETTLSRMPESLQERLHALVAERLKDI